MTVTLHSGERQVAPLLTGIRGDHRARYRFAAGRLTEYRGILDAGCGVGYGAWMLAEAGLSVYATDYDPEAIAYARTHYDHVRIRWSEGNICSASYRLAEAAVAFEVLEHLNRPGLALIRFPDILIASVPNAEQVQKTPGTFPHHVRHYSPAEFELLLAGAGYLITEWWCQRDTTDALLNQGHDGRTIIAVARR